MLLNSNDIRGALTITAIAAVLAFTVNLFHPDGYVFLSRKDTSRQIVYISTGEARIKHEHESALFIDSRESEKHWKAHISGALNIPVFPESAYTGGIKKYFSKMQEPVEIVIYCDGETCGSSKDLANRLIEMGYKKHLYIIKNGFPEWEKAGYPVDR